MALTEEDARRWDGVESLTIDEGGFLLYGIEPLSFRYEEEHSINMHYAFYDRHIGEDIAYFSKIIERAAIGGSIELGHQELGKHGAVYDWQKTYLKKFSFLNWCKSDPEYAFVATALDLATYQKAVITSTRREDESIPGKTPHTAVGKLAIQAAWEIEQSTDEPASTKDVMNRLQQWAENGSHPQTLQKSDLQKRGVVWVTGKEKPKTFDLEACGKALRTWRLSRA